MISLSTLDITDSVDLEEPEERKASDVASSSKTPLRLSPFWSWKGLHLAKQDEVGQEAHRVDGLADVLLRLHS